MSVYCSKRKGEINAISWNLTQILRCSRIEKKCSLKNRTKKLVFFSLKEKIILMLPKRVVVLKKRHTPKLTVVNEHDLTD